MAISHILGYPRIGPNRELKKAVEDYWAGKSDRPQLLARAGQVRDANWQVQRLRGLDLVTCNDFSLYDHVLDAICMVGAAPRRFGYQGGPIDIDLYFAMARGRQDAVAMEMTKWFDTNYHYLVPELHAGMGFGRGAHKAIKEFQDARGQGLRAKSVLLGPVSLLLLGRTRESFDRFSLLGGLLEIYSHVIQDLARAGAEWVQLDEPVLALDLEPAVLDRFGPAYRQLREAAGSTRILLATYFGALDSNYEVARKLPVDALHLDLVRSQENFEAAIRSPLGDSMMLSAGLINGRNIWAADLGRCAERLDRLVKVYGKDRLLVAPSCSLLHVPVDVAGETQIAPQIRPSLAFANQKIDEIVALTRYVNDGRDAVAEALEANAKVMAEQARALGRHDADVQKRLSSLDAAMFRRPEPFADRLIKQQARLNLPVLPTTTIGSFPQTPDLRKRRQQVHKGQIPQEQYEEYLRQEIREVIALQEEVGLDVLVHGEFERTDMVEYFAEQLRGFLATENGWVQSYGSRCIRPPIIYGDVIRPRPMTVEWITYTQKQTQRPVKGMLTGPVTILQWSFVREDQPRKDTCMQIALAVRDEVADLEAAGIRVIQIDEPALREGLPLRKARWPEYLDWAVKAFRLASGVARPDTQVHTHMCYADFNDIIEAISELDADVISIENSRSQGQLLAAFRQFKYDKHIGPGVYDIHSPRVPSVPEILANIKASAAVLPPKQLWVNPDCGLKTRKYEEVLPALRNMVDAAKQARRELGTAHGAADTTQRA
jgi:5-methyltetrahydropteroyltriglutamate--homocysteine methyltransferase